MTEQPHPRILCVDDEPHLLEGLSRTLRRAFCTTTALGADDGLRAFQKQPFPVVLSDLRMPGMDGLEFLAEVRRREPDTVCVLLTGDADLARAIAALNEGHVFRFLNKPCPSPLLMRSLRGAYHQYQLQTGHRQMFEETLRGTVAALCDMLGVARPSAFGRAHRLRRWLQVASRTLAQPGWELEMAAQLCQVGWLMIPEELLRRLRAGAQLSAAEANMLRAVPTAARRIAEEIPHLNGVRELINDAACELAPSSASCATTPRLPAGRLLAAALHLDRVLETEDVARAGQVLEQLSFVDAQMARALLDALGRGSRFERTIPLAELVPGMVFLEDVECAGDVIAARGQQATTALLGRLLNVTRPDSLPPSVRCAVPNEASE